MEERDRIDWLSDRGLDLLKFLLERLTGRVDRVWLRALALLARMTRRPAFRFHGCASLPWTILFDDALDFATALQILRRTIGYRPAATIGLQ